MHEWDVEAPDESEFAGMHGDEMMDSEEDESEDESEAGEGMAHVPFDPEDYSLPGEELRMLPCPAKLPHDLEVGMRVAWWFAHPFNAWHVGKVAEVNRE